MLESRYPLRVVEILIHVNQSSIRLFQWTRLNLSPPVVHIPCEHDELHGQDHLAEGDLEDTARHRFESPPYMAAIVSGEHGVPGSKLLDEKVPHHKPARVRSDRLSRWL